MKIILTLLSLFLNNSFAQGDCNITQVQPSPFCQGSSFDINNEQDILDYQTNFGDDGSGPRNVRIRSNLNVYDLNLKSPCEVSLDQKIKINATNNICIIGSKIKIKKQMDLTAQDVGIHSSENDFLIGEKAKISATNLSISSNGSLTIKKQAKFDVNQNMEIMGSGLGAGNGILIGEKFKGSGVSLNIIASSNLNVKKQFDANFSNLIDLKGIVQGSNSNFLLGEKAKINANKILINFKNVISFKKMAKITSLNELIISTADGGEDSSIFIGEKGKFSGQSISVASNDEIILKKKNSFEGSSAIFVDTSDCNFSADVSFITPTPQGRCIGPVNPNSPPVADAGADQILALGESLSLDGSKSFDVNGDRLAYEWTIVSAPVGSNPVLENPLSPFPKFNTDLNGTYEVSLRVNDGRVFSVPSTTFISSENVRPEILFLNDSLASIGDTVLLDGSNTIDLNDDNLTYEWTVISLPLGSTSSIIDSSQEVAQIFIDVEGDYEISLRVFDGTAYSKSQTLTISTNSILPQAKISGPGIVSKNQSTVLDGNSSINPNGGVLTYSWSLIYQEPSSVTNFLGGTADLTTFQANVSGNYLIQLMVDDGFKKSKPKTYLIKIQNQLPVINYSFDKDRLVPTDSIVNFDVSNSSDPDSDPITFSWTFIEKPIGSNAAFIDSTASITSFSPDVSGGYSVKVEVSDGEDKAIEEFTIFANKEPVADFSTSLDNFVGKSFTLNGGISFDPDGDPIIYEWELLSAPTDSLANIGVPNREMIDILADKAGTYQVGLTISDGFFTSNQIIKSVEVLPVVNEAPVIVPLLDQIVSVGKEVKFTFDVIDPENSPLRLSFKADDLQPGMKFNGTTGDFSWTPTLEQTGVYTLTFTAFDGKNLVSQVMNLTIQGPLFPGNTSITGRVLVSNDKVDFGIDKPIIGATVSVLNTNIVTTTNELGYFTLENIPNIEEIVFKIDSATATNNPENGIYANFIEILHPVRGVDNEVGRPFYLPVVAMDSITPVVPGQETIVFNSELGVEVRVPADSAIYPDGTPYNGDFSISLVPSNLAPVSLPSGLTPALLLTLQPSGIRFNEPAQVTYPNLDNLPPGTIIDITQMNDRSGMFEKVGEGEVSEDGKRIVTLSGGFENTSWFILQTLNPPPIPENDENNDQEKGCSKTTSSGGSQQTGREEQNGGSCTVAKDTGNSIINRATGDMVQNIRIDSHKSLGRNRGVTLIYSSLVATGTMVESFIENQDTIASLESISLRPVLGGIPLNDVVNYNTSTLPENNPSRILSIPLIFNTSGYDTGIYSYDVERQSNSILASNTARFSEALRPKSRVVFNPNQTMFGRAWTLQETMRIFHVEGGDAAVVRNGFEVWNFRYNPDSDSYQSPPNDYSVLTKENGRFVLTGKNKTVHKFDEKGLLLSSTDRNLRQTIYKYDSNEKIEYIQDPAGLRTEFSYGTNGFLSRVTSPGGKETQIVTDAQGNITEVINPDLTSKKFNYLENGLQFQKVYENGSVNTYEYNEKNQIFRVTKSGGEIKTYEIFEEIIEDNSLNESALNKIKESYGTKSLNLTVGSFRKENIQTCLEKYRSLANILSTNGQFNINKNVRALPSSSIGSFSLRRSQAAINDCISGNKERWITKRISPLGFESINEFDQKGNLLISVDPTNRGQRNFYDSVGNLVKTSNYIDLRASLDIKYDSNYNQLLQVKDYLGRVTDFEQDSKGNIVSVTNPLGQETKLSYNSKGQVVSIVDFQGKETSLKYDLKSGNLISVVDPEGNVTKAHYDEDGNLIQITDPKGQVTQFEYDEMNRVTKTIAADFSETSFTYDVKGNLLTVNDPRNGITTFVYDERDRVIERIDPKAQKEEFFYSEDGLLIAKKDRNSLVTGYEYDDDSRLTRRILDSGKMYSYTYDDAGRVLSIDDSENTISYSYDEVGRVKTTSFEGPNQPTLTLENEYDFNGNRTTLKTSEGDFVYSYDELNRLRTVENPNNLVFETVYDSIGRRAEMIIPNGTKVGYDYDKANRIKEISHLNGSTNLATFNYRYDDNGNITSVNTSRSALSNLSPTLSYTYDSINQLISATNPIQGQVDETFNYDNLGNRLRNQNQTQYAVYDESNRLLENQTHTYTYDLEGNMTSKEDKGTGFLTQYTWDEENQLIQIIERNSISTPSTKTVNYVYDVLGRRIEKSIDGVITRYIYDNEDILFELDGNNQITKVFTHGGGIDEPLSFEDKLAQQTYFYHADHLGSIIGLSNSSGNLVQNYVYDSFGKVNIYDGAGTNFNLGNEPIKQPYGYTSRELDAESDLYYYRARYYNSSIGRFISEDPLGLEGEDLNLYRYADNRVLGFSDPFGLNSLVGGYPRFQRGRFGGGGIVVGLPFVFNPPQAPISDPNVYSKGDERKMGNKELKDLGIDAEELKESLGAKPSGKFDLFLDKKTGEILVKPKRGNGPGEPTGLNIKDLRQIIVVPEKETKVCK